MKNKLHSKIHHFYVVSPLSSINFVNKPEKIYDHTFLYIRFDKDDQLFDIFFDHNFEHYYEKVKAIVATDDEYKSVNDDEVWFTITNKTITIDYSHSRAPQAGIYTVSTKAALEIMTEYKKLLDEFNTMKQKDKKWHGIPTNPKYFQENNIKAMFYQPSTSKIGRYDDRIV
jgi:hypothetical protein